MKEFEFEETFAIHSLDNYVPFYIKFILKKIISFFYQFYEMIFFFEKTNSSLALIFPNQAHGHNILEIHAMHIFEQR